MQTLPGPAATISAQGASPQAILSATQDALPVTSDALPMLTPILQSKPGTLPPMQKPSLPHASPKIKPPPGSGSQSLKQPALPLWQMFGSASNRPALKVGMLAGSESLDLDVLAKAAVRKRKEQVHIAFQPELLVQAVAAMHSALLLDAIDLHCCVNCYRACFAYGWGAQCVKPASSHANSHGHSCCRCKHLCMLASCSSFCRSAKAQRQLQGIM